MFAALKYRHPHATLRYSEYCLLSTQQRYTEALKVQKQMYKVHQPHVHSGYITKAHYARTTNADGQPDWLLLVHPGSQSPGGVCRLHAPVSRGRHGAPPTDRRRPGGPPEHGDPGVRGCATVSTPRGQSPTPRGPGTPGPASTCSPSPSADARPHPLGSARGGRRARCSTSRPAPDPGGSARAAVLPALPRADAGHARRPKNWTQALELLAQHGAAKAQFLLAFAHQEAPETRYRPRGFGGILHYLPRALAAYDARAAQGTHATTRQAVANERAQA